MSLLRQPVDTKSEARAWSAFARDYEQKVFSPTSFFDKRQRLIEGVVAGEVFVAGAGPLGQLECDLLQRNAVRVVSGDFCLEMLLAARSILQHERLVYVAADNRQLPFPAASMDAVISVNSIIPKNRGDVRLMFGEFSRVLKHHGKLIALLPAFEMSLESLEHWRAPVILDQAEHQELDTTGWQSFHTRQEIASAMSDYRFERVTVERMEFSNRDEIAHITNVYANLLVHSEVDALRRFPLWEHLLIASR